LEKRKKENPLSVISEWEKIKLRAIFKQYDKDKKATVKVE